MKKRLQIFIINLFVLIILTSCAQKVGVTRITLRERFRKFTSNIFNEDYPSERTIQFLALRGMLSDWHNDPVPVLISLDKNLIDHPNRDTLFALMELCFYEAEQEDELSDESLPFHVSSMVYAYKYLFDPEYEPPISPYSPYSRLTCDIYNRSLADLILYAQSKKIRFKENMRLPMINGGLLLEQRHSELLWKPEEFDNYKVTYRFEVKGIDAHYRTYGIGVPIIAVRSAPAVEQRRKTDKYLPMLGQTFSATAFLRLKETDVPIGKTGIVYRADLELYDASRKDEIRIDDKTVPLETDFTTPLAYKVSQTPEPRAFLAMLDVDIWKNMQGLHMLEPYHSNEVPVVFIHGLMSDPRTWLQMLNDLMNDPVLRKRCQFWFFMYPTGNPVLYSAAGLRKSLHAARESFDPEHTDPSFDQMVLVGHSMGGLLTQFMVQESSNLLLNAIADKPLDEYDLEPETSALIEDLLLFDPLPFVTRAIFISTPHRGSALTYRPIALFGAWITKLGGKLTDTTADFMTLTKESSDKDRWEVALARVPTGIDSLRPDNPALIIMAKQPIASNITFHSIIGNNEEADKPGGTDGIVPYESSHLDGAESEMIVHSGHGAQSKPRSIFEVRRILHEHLDTIDKKE